MKSLLIIASLSIVLLGCTKSGEEPFGETTDNRRIPDNTTVWLSSGMNPKDFPAFKFPGVIIGLSKYDEQGYREHCYKVQSVEDGTIGNFWDKQLSTVKHGYHHGFFFFLKTNKVDSLRAAAPIKKINK